MKKAIDYHFSLISPFTYLGHQRFEALAKGHQATVNYKPSDLGKIFPVSGGLPLAKRAPQRLAYRIMELKRWRVFLDIPLNLSPKFFPVPEIDAARVVTAAILEGSDPGGLIFGFLKGVWIEERDISDEKTIIKILGENGFDPASLWGNRKAPEISEALEKYTEDAIEKGVFGAPTWIYEGELFWGQDRLDFLVRALAEQTD